MDLQGLLYGIIDTAIYSLVGIIMMIIGFAVVNFITPFSVKKEIEDDQNTALGIIIGSVIIGLSIIIGSVISSPSSSYPKSPAEPAKQAVETKAETK